MYFRPFIKSDFDCRFSKSEALSKQGYRSFIEREFAANSEMVVFDPASGICPGETCKVFDEEAFLYADSHHVTVDAAIRIFEKAEF